MDQKHKIERYFDVNRRISIPSKILYKLKIDYTKDGVIMYIQDDKIIIEKKEVYKV